MHTKLLHHVQKGKSDAIYIASWYILSVHYVEFEIQVLSESESERIEIRKEIRNRKIKRSSYLPRPASPPSGLDPRTCEARLQPAHTMPALLVRTSQPGARADMWAPLGSLPATLVPTCLHTSTDLWGPSDILNTHPTHRTLTCGAMPSDSSPTVRNRCIHNWPNGRSRVLDWILTNFPCPHPGSHGA
jgi:hypothetical protein